MRTLTATRGAQKLGVFPCDYMMDLTLNLGYTGRPTRRCRASWAPWSQFSPPFPAAGEPGPALDSDQLSATGVFLLLRQEGLVLVRVPTPCLTPTALLVYRVFRNEAKRTTKILHGLLHGFAFIIALVGEFPGTALPPGLQASQAGRGHWVLGREPRSPG